MLLDALEPGTVFWGHHFQSYTKTECNRLKVTFSEKNNFSSSESEPSPTTSDTVGDILVGCDGIWSCVREQKLKEKESARYLGVMVVLGRGSVEHELASTDPDR